MAKIVIQERTQTPPRETGAVAPPLSLADESGAQALGQVVTQLGEKHAVDLIESRAANEYSSFQGGRSAELAKFDAYIASHPGDSFEQLEKERAATMLRIGELSSLATTLPGKERIQNDLLRNKGFTQAKTTASIQAIRSKQEFATYQVQQENNIKNFDKNGYISLQEQQVDAGLLFPDLAEAQREHDFAIMDSAQEKLEMAQAEESITAGFQTIIDNGGSVEDARGVVLEAKNSGAITAKQAQSLNSSVNGYASGKDKEATRTRNQKTTAGYHEASNILISGGATINSIKDLGLPTAETAFLESMISKSHNKPDVETRSKGQDKANQIVMQRSLEQMSDVEAIQAAMTEYYDKKTISEETYEWTMDKIQNKYPRELVPTISSKIESQGADWWGISEGEKVVMKRNRDFTDQVDKLLTDEQFVKKPIQDQIGIIEGEMAALKAGTPLQDPNDITLDAPLDGFTGFPTKHPMVKNKDGSRSNVILSGATLDDGRIVAFPTMVDGVKHTPDEALKIAEENGIENYPFFDSIDELNEWAEANHANFDENGNLSKSASGDDFGREPRIRVVSPDGVSGTIPASDLTEFISRGFKAID
jgi:hypothetical protein